MLHKATLKNMLVFLVFAMFSFTILAGCSGGEGSGETEEMEMEHDDMDMDDGDDHEHMDEETFRIPNNGSVIRIASPENGAAFSVGDDVVVEVEIENFELNVDGSHWHVYVDGVSYGMVVGNTTSQVLRNLEPGEHMITAHLANGDHEELEDPGMVMIMVNE